MKAFAELNGEGTRICVYFPYNEVYKDKVKSIGAHWNQNERYWYLPVDLTSGRRLREIFGQGLELGKELAEWGRRALREESKMHSLALADDHPLEDLVVYEKMPEFAEWLRPYQRADIAYMAQTSALNLNEQRLGKTSEMIGVIFEAGLEEGQHLICAPQKSLDSVWRMEFERWTDLPVYTFSGETHSTDRAMIIGEVEDRYKLNYPFVFVTTSDMVRRGLPFDIEIKYKWTTFIIDEYHKTGLGEVRNKFPQKCQKIKAERRYALSGTPMGGKPIKLWGGLHFLDGDKFGSKWRWAQQWLEVEDNKIGGIQKGREDDFYKMLAPYAVRRLRTEVLPQLPPKQVTDIWCTMTPTQRAQYNEFAEAAEVRIDEYHLSATGVLAEYTRLKQFANARQTVEVLSIDPETEQPELRLKPTYDSGKIPYLLQQLAEAGIDPEDMAGDSQAIVASQFRAVVDMYYNYLTEKGIPCIRITGKVTKAESERAQRAFKHGSDSEGLRVCCMVTTMGVGITLNNVQTVHVMDGTWNPDNEEQLSDRAIDTNRDHQVTVFNYRSLDSIEKYVHDVAAFKTITNKNILDLRRQGLRSTLRGTPRSTSSSR